MHNIERKEFTNKTLDELVRYADDKAYKIWVPAHTYHANAFSTVAPTLGQLYNGQVWILGAASADTAIVTTLARPSTWLSGTIRTKVFYTGDIANNNFYVSSGIDAYMLGDITSGAGLASAVTLAIPSQTVIHQLKTYDLQESAVINQSHEYFTHNFNRYSTHGSDTNAGDMYVFGCLISYTEGNRSIGIKTV